MRIFRMLLLLTAAVVAAQAQAVTWYLQNVIMSDGAQAVGSFTYDAAANVFSNIDVQTLPVQGITNPTNVEAGGGYKYLAAISNGTGGLPVAFQSDSPSSPTTRLFEILSSNTLTNNGGTVTLTAGAPAEGYCGAGPQSGCQTVATGYRTISSGTLVGASSTDTPQTWYFTATFPDGGQALGSFVYNKDSNTFSNIDISTTTGSLTGTRYTAVVPGSTAGIFGFAPQVRTAVGAPVLLINLGGSTLTNSNTPDRIPFPAGTATDPIEGICATSDCPAATFTTSRSSNVALLTNTPPANYTKILSQIADGGNYISEILLTNLSSIAQTYTVTITQDNGNPFTTFANTNGHTTVTVGPRTTAFIQSNGSSGPSVNEGWVRVDGANNFSVQAIFTELSGNAGGNQPASVNGDTQGSSSLVVPFDSTNGNVEGLAITNSDVSSVVVVAVGYDQNGNIIMTDNSLSLPGGHHIAFNFGSATGQRYAALVGQKGQLRLLSVRGGGPPYIGLNAMLLHAISNAAITSVSVTAQ